MTGTTAIDSRVWFITGGTPGGFGMAYAEAALHAGDRVVLTARRTDLLDDWAAPYGDRVLVRELDVTDEAQVQAVVAAAEAAFGQIDVLINNAGRGWVGSVEGSTDALVRQTFELNFFAVVSVARAVLPGMRARRRGWIINMSSVAGIRGVVGFGYYSAAKHAIEGLTAVLRREVAGLGIHVLSVEPGAFRTQAYAGFADEAVHEQVSEYQPLLDEVRAAMVEQHGRQPGDPRRGVDAVIAAMRQSPPPQRIVLGSAAYDVVTATLEEALADVRANEELARRADFPLLPDDLGLDAVD